MPLGIQLPQDVGCPYGATAKFGHRTTALRSDLWHYRGFYLMVLCSREAQIAVRCFRLQAGGLYRGHSTALPRIWGTSYRATDACSMPCTALLRTCGSATAADIVSI